MNRPVIRVVDHGDPSQNLGWTTVAHPCPARRGRCHALTRYDIVSRAHCCVHRSVRGAQALGSVVEVAAAVLAVHDALDRRLFEQIEHALAAVLLHQLVIVLIGDERHVR